MAIQARTRLARRAVVDAARDLFVERGFGATTVEAISEAAGVPAATVYRLFSGKVGMLKALLDVSIVGDDEAVPLAQRPHVRSLLADPDPRSQLAGFVAIAADVNSRVAPIYLVLVSAAGAEPDAAALFDQLNRQRQEGQRRITRSLARSGSLRAGLRPREAADVVHALLSPEVYRLLVIDRGWRPARYQEWVTTMLAEQLLPPPPGREPGSAVS